MPEVARKHGVGASQLGTALLHKIPTITFTAHKMSFHNECQRVCNIILGNTIFVEFVLWAPVNKGI